MSFPALAVIRPFVKISSRIAPKTTGNIAFRVFCRPPQPKGIDDAQKKLTDRAEARLALATATRVSFSGGEVQIYRFKTDVQVNRGTVLLVHGWTGRSTFMLGFVEPLLKSGFDVIAVDLPAHGKSLGKELHIPLAVQALHKVHEQLGPFNAIVAHSFGGAVATALMSGVVEGTPAVSTAKLVLIASPHSVPAIFRHFGASIGLGDRAQYYLESNVLRLSGNELTTFEGARLLHELGVPTLVLHAPDDKEVSFASAEAFASAGNHVTLRPMPGLGHRRILYSPSTIKATVAFVDSGHVPDAA
jgi:pimeloyl-ACP methyl ester carboxylesterase